MVRPEPTSTGEDGKCITMRKYYNGVFHTQPQSQIEGKGPLIGINLGTTNSCVGVWLTQHQRIEIITNDHRLTPSFVAFTKTERLIREAAKNQAGMNPANTIFGPDVPSLRRSQRRRPASRSVS